MVLQRKRTVRNIVLVPYKPKLNNWGSWRVESPYATSTVASPILDDDNQIQTLDKKVKERTNYPMSPTVRIMNQCVRHNFMKICKSVRDM